ncbi:MAG: GNAT family N-acetyltransferase [Cyanobacteria bacterium J06642_3]
MANSIESNILQIDIDNFIMRSLQTSDLNDLAEIGADLEVTRFLPGQGLPISLENTQKTVEIFVEHWQQRKYGIWAIVNQDSSQMIGYCGLRYLK